MMPIAITLSLPDLLNIAVAVGTLSLAGATFWMARGTSKLAETAEKQRQATIVPVVRLVRRHRHDIAQIRVARKGEPGEFLLVPLENLGPLPVTIESVELKPGGIGEVASQEDYLSPEILPGVRRDFHFSMSTQELADCKSGGIVVLTVTYRTFVTGSQFAAVERVQQSMDGWGDEQWVIVGPETPRRLDWVEA